MKHFCWDDSGFGSLLNGSRFISLGIGICFQEKDTDFGERFSSNPFDESGQ